MNVRFTLSDLEQKKKAGTIRGYSVTGEQKKEKKSKYGNKVVVVDGIKFHSKREANKYFELKMRQAAGEITDLQLQVEFQLSICKYFADFTFRENGKLIVVDAKGFRTKEYRMKKKMMLHELGITITEV